MSRQRRTLEGTVAQKAVGPAAPVMSAPTAHSTSLATDISRLIAEARRDAVVAVNAALTLLYWRVGQRIGQEVLGGQQRADYGAEVIERLADALVAQHGQGFTAKNLRHMVRFAQAWPDEEIVYALSRHLSWTHLRALLYFDDPLKRDFYADSLRSQAAGADRAAGTWPGRHPRGGVPDHAAAAGAAAATAARGDRAIARLAGGAKGRRRMTRSSRSAASRPWFVDFRGHCSSCK
jgi:hypothetical protein